MSKRFICEPLKPVMKTAGSVPTTIGEPVLPSKFIWRDDEYTIDEILGKWKETGPCKVSNKESYLRKHWYRIRTTDGTEMTIYFERQARSKSQNKKRWWLHTVSKSTP